jgi:hypothetical protein
MMSRERCGWSRNVLFVLVAVTCLATVSSHALILVGGPGPVEDRDWPKGAVEVANLQGRFRWTEGPPFGGGEWRFEYRGNTQAFNDALEAFAQIRAPKLQLVVHDGPGRMYAVNEDEQQPVHWAFTIWNARSFHQVYSNPRMAPAFRDSPLYGKPVPPPRLDVYVGGGSKAIDWDRVEVPEGIEVADLRAVAAAVTPVGGGLVVGHVYDMATQKPVEGATVTLEVLSGEADPMNPPTGTVDADGALRIERIPPGSYNVNVSAEEYAHRRAGRFGNSQGTSYMEVLVYLAREHELEGVVVDTDGSPAEGVELHARGPLGIDGQPYPLLIDPEPVVTDKEGRFRVPFLPEGFVGLWCGPGWHSPAYSELYGVPHSRPGRPEDTLRITATRTGTIHGRVIGADGNPASGKPHVSIEPEGDPIGRYGGSAQADADGTFDFTNVPPDGYRIGIGHGLAGEEDPNRISVTLKPGEKIEVELKAP